VIRRTERKQKAQKIMEADYTKTFDMTILTNNEELINKTWRFTRVQTMLWEFHWNSGKPYLHECNGNIVRGEEVGHEVVAREEIAEQLADRGIAKTDEEIAAMAKDAVAYYMDDEVRAECWNNAIGVIVENS
jgi:hypothetical protein